MEVVVKGVGVSDVLIQLEGRVLYRFTPLFRRSHNCVRQLTPAQAGKESTILDLLAVRSVMQTRVAALCDMPCSGQTKTTLAGQT